MRFVKATQLKEKVFYDKMKMDFYAIKIFRKGWRNEEENKSEGFAAASIDHCNLHIIQCCIEIYIRQYIFEYSFFDFLCAGSSPFGNLCNFLAADHKKSGVIHRLCESCHGVVMDYGLGSGVF